MPSIKDRRYTFAVCLTLALLLAIGSLGCSRSYYRRQADADARRLIEEKSDNPYWATPDFTIKYDPRSRMEDPFSADHPPLPPDDPAAHQFMEDVDGKPNYPHWHANGDTQVIENPDWRSYLPVREDGSVVLDLETAFRLALMHSRDYQSQKEELYLSALDVSLERFSFETQFFLPGQGTFEHTGRLRTGDSQTNVLLGSGPLGTRLQKAGITGSQLVVNLANSLVWQLSGPDSNSVNSALGFQLVQPLLQGAGRDVVLASLTQAERNLLANVRQFERYRRGFYLQITTGGSPGSGPLRGGGFLNVEPGGTAGVGGMIGLLLSQQNIRIQEANVASQRSTLGLFREFAAADRISLLQLQQFRTSLYNVQSNLLQAKANYQTQLDSFKILLGLPPDIEIIIDDPFLDQFILIDEGILTKQRNLTKLQEEAGEVKIEVIQSEAFINADDPDSDFGWSETLTQSMDQMLKALQAAEKLRIEIEEVDMPQSERDIEMFNSRFDARVEDLQKLQETLVNSYQSKADEIPVVDADILDRSVVESTGSELQSVVEDLRKRIALLQETISTLQADVSQLKTDGPKLKGMELKVALVEKVFDPIPKLLTEMSSIVIEISLLQARARNDSLMLENIEISAEQALEIARVYRRDWMNTRAALVDNWRNIEFFADDLESQLDLTFAGDMGNQGDNPFDFRLSNGRIFAGFQFDAPITRLGERNAYRQALINYQRSRRSYMLFVDQILQQLRLTIRNINVDKLNFEIRRQSVKVAVQQLELARFQLEEPPRPGQAATRLGSTTARDLVDAFNNLQNAQFSLVSLFVDYEVLRRNLDFQMGTMQLDPQGFWLDPGPITPQRAFDLVTPYCELPRLIDQPQPLSQPDINSKADDLPAPVQVPNPE